MTLCYMELDSGPVLKPLSELHWKPHQTITVKAKGTKGLPKICQDKHGLVSPLCKISLYLYMACNPSTTTYQLRFALYAWEKYRLYNI